MLVTPITPHDVPRLVPFALSVVAGFVDAVTFLGLFGFFIAQVTGSYVFVGAGVVSPGALGLTQLLAVPVFFLAGVAATLLAAAALALGGRPLVWTMLLECALLATMTAASLFAAPFSAEDQSWAIATALVGLATMGVQAAQVRVLMRGTPSTNVMTANTAQLAVDVAQFALARRERGGAEPDWLGTLRQRLAGTASVMAGFFCGTVAGALVFALTGFVALLVPLGGLTAVWVWALMAAPRAKEM